MRRREEDGRSPRCEPIPQCHGRDQAELPSPASPRAPRAVAVIANRCDGHLVWCPASSWYFRVRPARQCKAWSEGISGILARTTTRQWRAGRTPEGRAPRACGRVAPLGNGAHHSLRGTRLAQTPSAKALPALVLELREGAAMSPTESATGTLLLALDDWCMRTQAEHHSDRQNRSTASSPDPAVPLLRHRFFQPCPLGIEFLH